MDYNATAPIEKAVIEAMVDAMASTGNASSVHASGRNARKIIEQARAKLAGTVNCRPRDIVFTSGGTEANNTVIYGSGAASIIASTIEHDSVLGPVKSLDIPTYSINVDESGVVSVEHLKELLEIAPSPALVCIMMANNEIGTIQPIAEYAALAHEYGAIVLCDAIQAFGKLELDFEDLGVDYLTLSAHKMGGPQGVGAIILKPTSPLSASILGGGQELGRRSGTENVAAISGFGEAAMCAYSNFGNFESIKSLKTYLENSIRKIGNDIIIVADKAPRTANTSCIILPGMSGETQVMHFDLDNICVSSGSACSSGKVKVSHVLTAMGYESELANCSIRISFGSVTTKQDIDLFLKSYSALYLRSKKRQ